MKRRKAQKYLNFSRESPVNSDWVKQGEEVRREKRCRERGVVSLLCFHTDREVSFSPQRKWWRDILAHFSPGG